MFSSFQRRSMDKIIAAAEKVISDDELSDLEQLTVKSLPQGYVFETGLTVELRSATNDDLPRLYALMRSVADTGQGFGLDEFPTLRAFHAMISGSYVVVVEEVCSRKVKNAVFPLIKAGSHIQAGL